MNLNKERKTRLFAILRACNKGRRIVNSFINREMHKHGVNPKPWKTVKLAVLYGCEPRTNKKSLKNLFFFTKICCAQDSQF
jgi:hypothetical protein